MVSASVGAAAGVALVVLAFAGVFGPVLRPAAGVLVVAVVIVAWALWHERIPVPPAVRPRALVVALLVWAASLAVQILIYGPDGFDGAGLVVGTLLATATWWPIFGAVAVYVRAAAAPVPAAPDPPRADPAAHLSSTERGVYGRLLRADEPLDTIRDRDGRHAPDRILRIEVLGWSGVAGSFLALNLAAGFIGLVSWWLVAPVVVVSVAGLVLGERLLGLMTVARRRRRWLRMPRPATSSE